MRPAVWIASTKLGLPALTSCPAPPPAGSQPFRQRARILAHKPPHSRTAMFGQGWPLRRRGTWRAQRSDAESAAVAGSAPLRRPRARLSPPGRAGLCPPWTWKTPGRGESVAPRP